MLRAFVSKESKLSSAQPKLRCSKTPPKAGFCTVILFASMRTQAIADLVARCSLLLLAFLLPFFVLPVSWAGVGQAKLVLGATLLLFALAAWLVARLAEARIRVPRHLLPVAAALLPLAYLVSALASRAGTDSFVAGDGTLDTVSGMTLLLCTLVMYALVFFAGSEAEPGGAATPVLRVLLAGAGVVLAVQAARLFLPATLSLGGALSGNASSLVGSWHDLAIFLALVVVFAGTLWSSPSLARGPWRSILMVLGVFSLAMLVVISMADVWYTLSCVLLLFALFQWASARLRERRSQADSFFRALVCLGVGVFALANALASPFIYAHLPPSLQMPAVETRPSWQGTFTIAQNVFHGTGLIFGTGPNTFTRAWDQFKPVAVNQTQFWSVDFSSGIGVIPTSLITSGILGAIAWLAFLLAILWSAWKHFARERMSPAHSLPAALSASALLLAAFLIFYVPGPGLSFMLFLILGLLTALEAGNEGAAWSVAFSARPARLFALAAVLVFALALAGASVYSLRASISDLLVSKAAADYRQTNDLAAALALVQDALRWYPNNDTAHRASVEIGFLQLQQLTAEGHAGDAALLQKTLADTIQEGLRAVSIDSRNYQNWLSLATLYQNLGGAGVSGAYQNALDAYKKAAAANPTNPLPLVGAAQAESALGDSASAISYLDQALALKPNLAAAYYMRSQLEGVSRNFAAAIADAKQAVQLSQQDPLGWYNLGTLFYVSGDSPDAKIALMQAVSLNNEYANALFMLALADDKTGDHQGALAAMQKVVELNPQDPNALSALQTLESGKPLELPGAANASN